MVKLAGLPVIPPRSLPSVPAGAKRTSIPISLMSAVRAGQSGIAIFSILLRYGNRGSRFAPAPSTVAAIRRRSPTTPSSGMRLGLCAQLKRLWIRLVMKTVLPERLKPVTASQTVAPPASSPRLRRSGAWAKIGDRQLKVTKDGITNPIAQFSCRRPRESGDPRPPASGIWVPACAGTTGGGLKIGLSQVESGVGPRGAARRKVAPCSTVAVCSNRSEPKSYAGKPPPAATLTRKGFPAHWLTQLYGAEKVNYRGCHAQR